MNAECSTKVLMVCSLLMLLIFLTIVPAFGQVPVAPGNSPGGTITLEGECEYVVIVTGPQNLQWDLNVGPNSIECPLQVTCTGQSWQVTATDQNPVTKGHFTEYDSEYDPSYRLASPLILSATYEIESREVDLSQGGVIASGGPTLQAASSVPVVLNQDVSWSDLPKQYRIEITYAGNIII